MSKIFPFRQHPPKVKHLPKTVPKLVIKPIGGTGYDSYISETLSTEECHPAKEADDICRGPSDQCQDHTCEEDKATPSQIDHQCRRPGHADTNRVVTSQVRKELK